MELDNKTKDFLISYIGIDTMSSDEQEEILGYLWNSINAKVFDLVRENLGAEEAHMLEDRFGEEGDTVLYEVRERIDDFDTLAKDATIEVIEEFKKVRSAMPV